MPVPHETEEQQNRHIAERAMKRPIGHSNPSMHPYGYDYAQVEEPSKESIWHPMQAVQDILLALNKVDARLDLIHKQLIKSTRFEDRQANISTNVGYTANYLEHRFIVAYAFSNVTLVYSTGGTVDLTANNWINISPMRGTIITALGVGDANPVTVLFRACDSY